MDEHIDKKLAQAQETIEQFESLIDFQRECAAEASKLWQQAHNKPDTLPDIGVLIKWLVSEIENKKYTITCAAEENQQLKESLAEARAEIERLKNLVIDCTDWNWLDEDAFDTIPENITDATDAIVKERLNIGG